MMIDDIGIFSLFLIGLSLGAIMMALGYNLFLYLFHRDRIFLYYSLVQFGLVGVLLYDSHILQHFFNSFDANLTLYKLISMATLSFILLFTQEFFEMKKRFAHLNRIVNYILIFIILNIPFYESFIIFDYGLYLFIFLFILFVAFRALKVGFKWAKFFLAGWGVFIVSVFVDSFVDFDLEPFSFTPMMAGAVIEAIIFSIVIACKFKELKDEKEKEHLLLLQNRKLSSLGELLGNIAHQWRQPLSRLGYMMMNIKIADNKEREKLLQDAQKELSFMSDTIDDFREFYAPSKQKEQFLLSDELKKALSFIDMDAIEVILEVKDDAKITNYRSFFRQVVINIVQNAKEVLLQQKITDPKIDILIDNNMIQISDNGGGIKEQDIERIFEPYFSTKEHGMGVGLYMSKVIVEKQMDGRLRVENSDRGAKFTLMFS